MRIPFGNNVSAPADDNTAHPALKMLSQAARNNSIYVAFNIHEEYSSRNKTFFYNTNVVFDRTGRVVARYRKYNLFSEVRFLNITENPEHMFFDSDFGVRFGTFTCFDILFREPTLKLKNYNVTDYIFPTWWFSELPHLTAIQEQAGWSYATDSTLLAAGGNDVSVGSTGSGIYAGKKGPIIYIQSNRDGTTLLTAKVYKKGRNGNSTGTLIEITPKSPNGTMKMKTEISLKDYNTAHLTPELNILLDDFKRNPSINVNVEKQLCQGGFCCYFSVYMTLMYKNITDFPSDMISKPDRFNNYEYKLAIFNGVRTFDGFATGGIQVCSIIPCLNKNISSCGKTTFNIEPIHVKSDISSGNILVTIFNKIIIKTITLDKEVFAEPSILESSENSEMFGSLMNNNGYDFFHRQSISELRLSSKKLGTAGIFARVFTRDGLQPTVYSSANVLYSSLLLIISSSTVLIYY